MKPDLQATRTILRSSGVLIAGFLLAAAPARAESFAEQCPDIPTCATRVSALLGQKYIFDSEIKGAVTVAGAIDLNKDNAELLFTNLLHLNGYSRVPMGAPLTYQILKERDARDTSVPSFSSDAKSPPQLPNTWDIVNLKYKASNPESVEMIARTLRSFLPANARIVPTELSGMLIVTASAPEAKKAYELIVENDVKPSPALKKRFEEMDKIQRAEAVQKRDQIPPHKPDAPDSAKIESKSAVTKPAVKRSH